MKNTKPGLSRVFIRNIMFVTLGAMGLVTMVWIWGEIARFNAESELLRSAHTAAKEEMLEREVAGVIDYIDYMRSRTEDRLKAAIQGQVVVAHQIATNLYRQNRGLKSEAEIKKLIKEALRPIRFSQGRGYVFAVSMDGIEQLYPVRPELEGENIYDLRDAKGNYVIQNEIDVVREFGEGVVTGFWPKPDKDPAKVFPKISFVKYFAPFDWYLGAGEYLDDVTSRVQQDVIDRVVDLRFGEDGYFFASTFSGDPLFSNGKITRGTENISDITDPNGFKVIENQQKAARQPGGGFVSYVWPKLDSASPAPKISFVKAIPEWEWVIGAGVYLDDVEAAISQKKADLKKDLLTNIGNSLLATLFLFLLFLIWDRQVSRKIHIGIDAFSRFFRTAAEQSTPMPLKELHFAEFVDVAEAANRMLADRAAAEKALSENELKFRTLFDFSPQSIALTEMETGRMVDVNQEFCRRTGFEKAEVIGRTTTELGFYSDADRDRFVETLMEHGSVTGLEMTFTIKNSTMATALMFAKQIELNRQTLLMTIFIDITEKKYMEARLRQSHKMESIGTLTGGIAHDFNNIMTIIIGNTELAMEDVAAPDPVRENLEEIHAAGVRAAAIVKQLLDFSRSADQALTPVSIGPVMHETLDFLRSIIPATIRFHREIQDIEINVLADPVRIHQVIMNLCMNAVHEMETTGGDLRVGLKKAVIGKSWVRLHPDLAPGDYAEIRVRDTGPGIDPEIMDRIFDPYFTTRAVGQGSGLGLAVVHGIVKNHGGAVLAENAEGGGALFRVFIPLTTQMPASAPARAEAPPQGKEVVLLVDDEAAIVKLTRQRLERLHYQVTAETNPDTALAIFSADPDRFDLVVTDMTMPQMNGLELSEKIKAVRPDMPVIICTGYSVLVDEETAGDFDVAAFLSKPVDKQELAKTIRRVLDGEK